MRKWDMYDIQKNRNSPEFLLYLEKLFNEKKYEKIIRLIKISGIFISYDYKIGSKKQIEQVTKFLNQNLKNIIPQKIEKFFFEISILEKFKSEVLNKVTGNYNALPQEKQAYYLASYVNEYIPQKIQKGIDSKSNPSDISDMNEVIISSFGMVLKDMMIKELPFRISGRANELERELIGNHLKIASELRAINNIIETWMFSDLDISYLSNTKKFTVREVGEFGKNKLMSQIPFLDVKAAKNSFQNVIPIDDINLILNIEKESLYNKITEYFYTTDFTQEYLGIPLKEWVTAYWCLYEISWRILKANTNKAKPPIINFSTLEWRNILLHAGVSELHLDVLLTKLTFSKQAKDLYDRPLIPFENGLVCLPNVVLLIDISQSLMSQLGIDEDKKHSSFSKKGTNFEKHIESLTKKQISRYIPNLKARKDNNFFELDLIFEFDNDLFIIESKTQKQPGDHKEFYRNQEELREYIRKFNRNADYFLNNKIQKDSIKKKLGIKKINNIYKVFVSNVYQAINFWEGVYIIDEINYYNFMNRNSPQFHIVNPINKEITSINVDSYLYSGKATATQFLSLINSSHFNERLRERIGIRKIDFGNQLNLFYSSYYIESGDHKSYDDSASFIDIFKDNHNKYF